MNQVEAEDDFDVAYRGRLDTYRRDLVEGLPPRAVAALALVPVWSERLLAAASVDLGSMTLEDFLARAESRRLCVRGPAQTDETWTVRRARVLMLLWPHLTPRLRDTWKDRVLEAVHRVPASLERLQFLVMLAATQSQVVSEVLAGLETWPDRETSARLLARLAAGTKATQLAERAWSELDVLHDPEDRLSLRMPLLPCLPREGGYIEKAEQEALALDDLEARARAYVRLSTIVDDPKIAHDCRSMGFDAARTITDAEERCLALCGIAAAFPSEERGSVTDVCLSAARGIASPIHRAHMLARMSAAAVMMPGVQNVARDTLAELRTLPGQTTERDRAVASLAVPLATNVDEATALANDVRDPAIRLEVSAAIAASGSPLPAGSPPRPRDARALERVEATGRWDLLSAFVDQVGPDIGSRGSFLEWLEEKIPDRQTWRNVVISVAARQPQGDNRERILGHVLRSIRTVTDERVLLHDVAQIAPYLSERLLDEACQFASTMREDRSCAMPDAVRPDVLLRLGQVFPPTSDVSLQSMLCNLGTALMSINQSGEVGLAPATVRWAEIASRCVRPRVAGEFLATTFDRLVLAGEIGEATEWYTIADTIAPIVGAELVPAISLGRRRVEVACRRVGDARHLQRYLHREDLEQAFQSLIADTPSQWALHYLGVGGVGKTMLLRHVMANLAVRDGRPLPVARVDFDHMKPEYPVREPAVLLVQLADELRLFLPSGAEDRYNRFQDRVLELHGALSREPMPGNPLQNIHIDEFDRLLKEFAALLDALPKPVILILDTCEELAKLEPEGESIPAVEATFEILQRLHERTSDIRVVFAGRRLLARAGAGWRAREATLSHRNAILPESQPFLRLQLIQGFTEPEVDRYITQIAGLQLDAERRAAILTRSLDLTLPADIEFVGDTGAAAATTPAVPRYNPFDVSLYADWVLADPAVSPQTLGSGETDPYVEMRLLRRIQDEDVRRLVPAAILLREFDQAMLKPLLPADERRATRVFGDLGGQEWIDFRDGFLRIDPNLLLRLQDYYAKPAHRELMASVTQQLAEGLDTLVREALTPTSPPDALNTQRLDAALRLLSAEAAASLWDAVDRRLTETANWSTAERICEVLLEQDHAAGRKGSPVAAFVRATLAAARIHNWVNYDAKKDWQQVAESAPSHPNPGMQKWLIVRARLGQGEIEPDEFLVVSTVLSARNDHWRHEQLCASLLAAKEAVLERTGALPRESVVVTGVNAELDAYSNALSGVATWDLPEMPRLTVQRWADWRAPVSIPDRVRLLLLDQQSFAPDLLIARLRETITHIDNVDADILAARLLQSFLKHHPLPPDLLAEIDKTSLYDPNRVPTAGVHVKAPTWFAMVGEALMTSGLGDRASALAVDVLDRARENQDSRAGQAATALGLRLMRRFRLAGAMNALRQLVRVQHPGSSEAHYDWIVRSAGSPEETRTVLADFDQRLSVLLRLGKPDDAHGVLDFVEANLLGQRTGRESKRPPFPDRRPDASAPPSVSVRWSVLHESAGHDRQFEGMRERAEALLEEAELLVLRLPDLAFKLFVDAHGAYREAGDLCGAFITAVSTSIAALKAGEEANGRMWFKRASQLYEEMRAQPAVRPQLLPSWQQHMDFQSIQHFRTSMWYPWLLRCAAINARLDEGAAGGPKTTAVSAEIEQFSRDERHPEFSLTAYGKAAPGPSFGAWLRGVLVTMGETALGFAILAGGIYGLWKFIQWSRRSEAGQTVLIILVVAVLSPFVISWIFLWLTRGAVLTNNLRLDIVKTYGDIELSMYTWLRLPLMGAKTARTTLRAVDQWFQPFRNGALRAHDPVGRALRSFKTMMPLSRLVVPTYVSPDAAQYCWEGLMALGLEPAGQRMGQAVAFLRAARSLPEPPTGEWAQSGVDVRAERGLNQAFLGAWGWPVSTTPPSSWRVLHLIGRARRGASGVLFTPAGAEQPVRISDLPLGRAAIVVVQEEPVSRIQRLDVDREQTSDTRQWAADVFAAGAQTVLLIPSLPYETAAEGIRAMGEKWGASKAPSLWTLVDGVAALRRRIYQHEPSAEEWTKDMSWSATEALNELACEVTLFARHPNFRQEHTPTESRWWR